MGILDKVTKMKNQGISEDEITTKLREERISPKDIKDALDQSKIKEAVDNNQDMQPSIMKNTQDDVFVPKTQEMQQEDYVPQEGYNEQEYYPQEGYDEYASTGTNTDTMIEIAEQVFSEKIEKMQNQLEKLNEAQTLSQVKVDSTSERLKRVETIIDNLQVSILKKIGSYGENLSSIKKEMSMMQNSMKKIAKPLPKKEPIKKISKK